MTTSKMLFFPLYLFVSAFFYTPYSSVQLINKAISPVFNPDRTVTLRLRAPEADEVQVTV